MFWQPSTPHSSPDAQQIDALKRARYLFLEDEALDAAIQTLEAVGDDRHPRLSRYLARLYYAAGRDGDAAALITDILPSLYTPGQWGFAQAGAGYTRALVAPALGYIVIPIPKSGSTSLTNLMAELEGRGAEGEAILRDREQYSFVALAALAEDVSDHVSIVCLRDPVERLCSFHQGNIIERDHLLVHAPGKTSFFGLSLKPTLTEFINRLDAYRRFFMTVWHHTAPLDVFLGANPGVFTHKVSMAGLDALVADIRTQHGLPPDSRRDMASAKAGAETLSDAQRADLKARYAQDYTLYGDWF